MKANTNKPKPIRLNSWSAGMSEGSLRSSCRFTKYKPRISSKTPPNMMAGSNEIRFAATWISGTVLITKNVDAQRVAVVCSDLLGLSRFRSQCVFDSDHLVAVSTSWWNRRELQTANRPRDESFGGPIVRRRRNLHCTLVASLIKNERKRDRRAHGMLIEFGQQGRHQYSVHLYKVI
jgi:hypothetical protein